jgi:Mn2+/Fe2+ NRAMP family transporter
MAPEPTATTGQPGGRLAASTRSTLLGAMFLMATSAIGPGFITQTTTFTVQLGAAFAFAIVISILIDIALQLNVWRVIGVSGRRAQELGNLVAPGLGWFMAGLLVLGGLVFNIGNVSGTGLGLDAMLGLDPKLGGAISALIAIGIFLSKKAGVAVDRIVVVLGLVMIALTAYIAITSGPPVGEALKNVVLPEEIDFLAITTLVGGTIGGYIVYAGAHRLLDSGVSGPEHVRGITRGSITGIVITGIMRVLLFLAILGVVAGGATLDPASPAASAFEQAAGEVGLRVFGIVLWAASITSVIGASYTSVSFVTSRTKTSDRTRTMLVVAFIAVTSLVVFAGAFNGLLLPIGIAVLLYVATRRTDLLRGYRYPRWLLVIGWAAWLLTLFLAVRSIQPVIDLFS